MFRKLPAGWRTYLPLVAFSYALGFAALVLSLQQEWLAFVGMGLFLFGALVALNWYVDLRMAARTGRTPLSLLDDE